MGNIKYRRREFLKKIGTTAAGLGIPLLQSCCKTDAKLTACKLAGKNKRHVVTLSFDDGFKKSSIKTAEIYEKYKLSACMNVIATAHLPGFVLPNEYHNWPVGDFGLWNELQARGHEIMPHGYKHENLKETPLEEAKESILRCLDCFDKELDGFNRKKAVFNFPYNASSLELEAWLAGLPPRLASRDAEAGKVMAFRTGGNAINPLPQKGQVKLTCNGYGKPGNCEEHIEGQLAQLLSQESGWLIYNTHGLDDEGWAPIRASYLEKLLERLLAIESVEVSPAARALLQA
jgi:peptidoglycan/xylan/chitin deacetylase (PgdA/CDA1 family)